MLCTGEGCVGPGCDFFLVKYTAQVSPVNRNEKRCEGWRGCVNTAAAGLGWGWGRVCVNVRKQEACQASAGKITGEASVHISPQHLGLLQPLAG